MHPTTHDELAAPGLRLRPLDEATAWLRRAVSVPYEARDPGRWLREFQECVSLARRMLATRAAELRRRGVPQPRLIPLATREEVRHEQLARMADALFTDAYLLVVPDLLDMVDLTEAAKALERAVARQAERRSDLLYEADYLDLGGGG